MAYPNTDGLPPGAVVEISSFDHDLGQYVSVGTATVSEDGSTITSDPGGASSMRAGISPTHGPTRSVAQPYPVLLNATLIPTTA